MQFFDGILIKVWVLFNSKNVTAMLRMSKICNNFKNVLKYTW